MIVFASDLNFNVFFVDIFWSQSYLHSGGHIQQKLLNIRLQAHRQSSGLPCSRIWTRRTRRQVKTIILDYKGGTISNVKVA